MAVVDPCDLPTLQKVIEEDGLKVVAILLTHGHFDHSAGCEEMHKITGAPIYLHERNSKLQELDTETAEPLKDGSEITVGSVTIKAIATPGHTPGSVCYLVDSKLVTGDTLFVEGCGRCDLAGGDPHQMYNSFFNVIGSLPLDTEIYPGHDYGSSPSSTLAREKQNNRFYQCESEDRFISLRMG